VSPVDGWSNIDESAWPVTLVTGLFWDRSSGDGQKKEPNNDNFSIDDQQVPPYQTKVVMNDLGLMADKSPTLTQKYGSVYKCCKDFCFS
jgi:hypothetical protein